MREKPKGLPVLMGLCVLLAITAASAQTEPNYVRTTVKNVDGNSNDVVSTEYTDGLGRPISSQVKVNDNSALVSGILYDEAGRQDKVIKAFSYEFDGVPRFLAPDAFLKAANAHYQDSAYSATTYYDDPLGRVRAQGSPGKAFVLSSSHHSRIWYFGSKPGDATGFYESNGFLSKTGLGKLPATPADITQPVSATHFLTVTMDPNGNLSQSLTDIFGRTVRTRSYIDRTTNDANITAEYTYDILGNTLEEKAPDPVTGQPTLVLGTKYEYNTLGQVMKKHTPDAGDVFYRYDKAGRLRHVKSALHSANETSLTESFTAYIYDALGRNTRIEEISRPTNGSPLFDKPDLFDEKAVAVRKLKIRNFYDATIEIADLGVSSIAGILGELNNLRGRLVATVAYDETGLTAPENVVVDVYSYDDEGRIQAKYKHIPGLALQKTVYDYDLQGKLKSQTYYSAYTGAASVATQTLKYGYDEMGRAKVVSTGTGGKLVSYAYTFREGLLDKKALHNPLTQHAIATTDYSYYDIRGWLTGVRSTDPSGLNTKFLEDLKYHEPYPGATAQYNGNISGTAIAFNDNDALLKQSYSYDGVNRLIRTTGSNMTWGDRSEEIEYDRTGRITRKREGPTDLTGYTYPPGTNQLTSISGSPTKSDSKNFVYDPNGNMVLDKSKKMVIEIDWRGLPVKFKFYATVEDLPWNELVSGGLEKKGHKLVSEVRMVYDAGGNRVLKQTLSSTRGI